MSSILLVDNVFSAVQYPSVTLSGNEEATGFEARFFATLRREDHWTPTTFNADAWLKARHTQPRAVNTICLWVHNLLGEIYRFQISDDNFVSPIETVVDVTIPSTPGSGDIDDALGVVTEDFMWIKRFPTRYAVDFRHFVPAMGASQKPELNGIVGTSYSFDRNLGDLVDANDFRADEARSDRGVRGLGTPDITRGGSMPIQLPSMLAYEEFRFHLQRYDGTATGAPTPALLIFDETRAEQAVMVNRPLGRLGFSQSRTYFYPGGDLHFQEHDPRGAV
jgi:hypothetical protein